MTTQSHPENFVTVNLSPEVGVQKLIKTKVVDSDKGQIRFYQVQWDPTWESEQSLLKCCGHLIAEFWTHRAKEEENKKSQELISSKTASNHSHKSLPGNKMEELLSAAVTEPSAVRDSTYQNTTGEIDLSISKKKEIFVKPTIAGSARNLKPSVKAENVSFLRIPSIVQEGDSSVTELDDEDIDEVEEEYLDFSDDSIEFKEDSVDKDFVPERGQPSTDEDFESEDEEEVKPKKKKKSAAKDQDKKPKRRYESKVKPCEKCGVEYTSRRCPTCSLVECKDCGVKYNNSFYKEKCRACTNKCILCDQSFRKPSDVTRHMEAIHERVKKYNCTKCFKSFTAKQYLSAHMESHREILAFTCEICNKSYKTGRRLNRHKKTHTGAKPFHCKVCDRNFHQKIALKTHMLTHTEGPRRFQCLLCRKGFNHKVSLKSHMLKHHDKNEQQAAVMIGLWKKYQKDEAVQDTVNVGHDDVLAKALNAVAMNPLDGEQALHGNPNFPYLEFESL